MSANVWCAALFFTCRAMRAGIHCATEHLPEGVPNYTAAFP